MKGVSLVWFWNGKKGEVKLWYVDKESQYLFQPEFITSLPNVLTKEARKGTTLRLDPSPKGFLFQYLMR